MDSIMQTSLKITKTYMEVCSKGNKISAQEAETWSENQIKDISILMKDKLSTNPIEKEEVREIITIASQISKYKSYHQIISQIFDVEFLEKFAKYVQQEDEQFLINTLLFVQRMFLDKGYLIFAGSQELFSLYVKKFGSFQSQLSRQIATQILVEMMMDNKKLIEIASQPYYFVQFWLHTINQQNQMDRMLYWLDCVKSLYALQKAQELLFHENDLRLLCDIVVRTIENVSEGNMLKKPLQCYLSITKCKSLQEGGYYRAQDIKQFVYSLNAQEFDIVEEVEKINSLE